VDQPDVEHDISHSTVPENEEEVGFCEALKAPGVLIYSIVFFCVKAASYGLLYWLPTYLKSDLGFGQVTPKLKIFFA
jgi:hypothetical protein